MKIKDTKKSLETTLFALGKDGVCKLGLPPAAKTDNYFKRAITVGKLQNASTCFFNPDGKLFVVRGSELYCGPTPSRHTENWFDNATCVGRGNWDMFKFLFFSPKGKLYVVTKDGKLYKGTEPDNEHVPWLHREAKLIDGSGWERFSALCFNNDGILYGVTADKLLKGPPEVRGGRWIKNATEVGRSKWAHHSYFMGFSHDGNMWCVTQPSGTLYSAPPPTHKNESWVLNANDMGRDYRIFKAMGFTKDKTIKKLVSLDFIPHMGNIITKETEMVQEQVYNNRNSSSVLKATFTVEKTLVAESSFSHQHGFEVSASAELTVSSGVPFIENSSVKVTTSATTRHNWNLGSTNKIETKVSMKQDFELKPGECIKRKCIVRKALMDVTYCAKIITVFGCRATISGVWKGVSYWHIESVQEDLPEHEGHAHDPE
ncbi:uncharacterized protein [Ambystoma mexicanum]|uniref:uncharacterized protein n=1 Tax=Ambystoma mexicanum TaxID=8296 RepID=UPI0037E973EC